VRGNGPHPTPLQAPRHLSRPRRPGGSERPRRRRHRPRQVPRRRQGDDDLHHRRQRSRKDQRQRPLRRQQGSPRARDRQAHQRRHRRRHRRLGSRRHRRLSHQGRIPRRRRRQVQRLIRSLRRQPRHHQARQRQPRPQRHRLRFQGREGDDERDGEGLEHHGHSGAGTDPGAHSCPDSGTGPRNRHRRPDLLGRDDRHPPDRRPAALGHGRGDQVRGRDQEEGLDGELLPALRQLQPRLLLLQLSRRPAGKHPPARLDPGAELELAVDPLVQERARLPALRRDRRPLRLLHPRIRNQGEGLGAPLHAPLQLGDERQMVPLARGRQRQPPR
jgi:hypothetical protein